MATTTKKMGKKKSVISEAEKREMIQQGLSRKKECEAKALAIVQRLALADCVDREWLRDAGFYMTGNHYDDIIEERSCSQLCGYPLCANPLTQIFSPHQKYHISSQFNKVFDVTERKKFCSNVCFKRSSFFKEQLLSSPLWLREKEDAVRIQFHDEISAGKENASIVGHGDEVLLSPMDEYASIIKEVKAQKSEFANEQINAGSKSDKVDLKPDSSIGANVCVKKGLDEMLVPSVSQESKQVEAKPSTEIDLTSPVNEKATDFSENFDQLTISKSEIASSNQELSLKSTELEDSTKILSNLDTDKLSETVSDPSHESSNRVRFSPESDKKPEQARNIRPKKKQQESHPEVPALVRVTQCVQEWYTVETVRLIYGNKFLRQLLTENDFATPDLPEEDEIARNEIPDEVSLEVRARYIRLCQQLDMLEIKETQDDRKMLEENGEQKTEYPRKKLPDYEQLKKDAEKQELKIVSYIQGKTECESPEIVSKDDSSDRLVSIPLVDKHAQGALRRRIVHEQLDRVFPDLLKLFNLFRRDINDVLRRLILTFDFGPENISLKSQEWTLVAIILLKLISRTDKRISAEMNLSSSKKYLNMMLLGYGTGLEFLEQFLDTLHSDFKSIISKMPN